MLRMGSTLMALLLFISFVGLAQPSERARPMEHMREKGKNLKADLNLTAAQEKDLQRLRIDLEKKQTQVHSKLRLERLDLKGLMLADNPERAAIEKGMRSVSDLQFQLKVNMLDHWYAVKSILTPEQQKIWKEKIGGFMGEMNDHGGRMMKHREGRMRHPAEHGMDDN